MQKIATKTKRKSKPDTQKTIKELQEQITQLGMTVPCRENGDYSTLDTISLRTPCIEEDCDINPVVARQVCEDFLKQFSANVASLELAKIKVEALLEVLKGLPKETDIEFEVDWDDGGGFEKREITVRAAGPEDDENYLSRLKTYHGYCVERAEKEQKKAARAETIKGLKAQLKEAQDKLKKHGLT